MNVLDLFSGIGGFSLGLERAGMSTVAFCEIDKRARELLRQTWPNVPVFDDVRELNNRSLYESGVGAIDVICGGFPCQDISAAWAGPGLAGRRSGLWFEYARIIGEVQPRFVIIENVANLRKRGLAIVLNDLACMGYNADYGIIPASSVGAPHKRERLWITAWREWEPVVFSHECFDEDTGEESFCRHCRGDFGECDCIGPSTADDNGWECVEEDWGFVAYPNGTRWGEQLRTLPILPEHLSSECYSWYQHEPPVGRIFDGFSTWTHANNRLITESHKCIMAHVNKYSEVSHANAEKASTREVLRVLWDTVGAENFWEEEQIRRSGSISPEAVLFAHLCELKRISEMQNDIQPESAKIYEEVLRSVWAYKEFTCSSYRSRHDSQCPGEYTDAMQALSRLLAHNSETAWINYCRENAYPSGWSKGIALAMDGVPGRSYRIQKLGNSIVPFIPYLIGKSIIYASKM